MGAQNRAYEVVADRIVALLEQGTVPWRKPWKVDGSNRPRSVHGHLYRGINAWLLMAQGYSDPRWITFKQAQERGGMVRKGQKGVPVLLWKRSQREVEDPETGEKAIKRSVFATYYTVFNVEQCDGLNLKPIESGPIVKWDAIEAAEAIVAGMPNPPKIDHAGVDRAYYIPSLDEVHIPARSCFPCADEYYATLFHEVGHSTGHATRCNRKGVVEVNHFGSDLYGREELVAEMTSAYLCAESGIESTFENSAAYIGSWIRTIREDPSIVVIAAAQAQKAADYVLGVTFKDED